MTDSPEIKRLREQASSDGIYPTRWVTLAHAEQAVRETETRVRGERVGASGGRPCPECGVTRWEAKQADGWVAEAVERRTREIVEALRDQIGSDEQDVADAVAESAADFIESRFIQGDE